MSAMKLKVLGRQIATTEDKKRGTWSVKNKKYSRIVDGLLIIQKLTALPIISVDYIPKKVGSV